MRIRLASEHKSSFDSVFKDQGSSNGSPKKLRFANDSYSNVSDYEASPFVFAGNKTELQMEKKSTRKRNKIKKKSLGSLVLPEKKEDWGKFDLSQNLSDMLKPSQPNFGYGEELTFDTHTRKNRKGWGIFLDCIQKYPKRERVHSLAKNIIDAKKAEEQKIRELRKLRKQYRLNKNEHKPSVKFTTNTSFYTKNDRGLKPIIEGAYQNFMKHGSKKKLRGKLSWFNSIKPKLSDRGKSSMSSLPQTSVWLKNRVNSSKRRRLKLSNSFIFTSHSIKINLKDKLTNFLKSIKRGKIKDLKSPQKIINSYKSLNPP
ncbi:unnamed protein product [Moneuplotes crassus]|uniref:Uncharacterized protein n=1 Tax=Euplotes crassus TaxID=5936 RepID=A0AAD1UM50_EUPCR|nr:unnamed protein product [Moneuplotes crassus]